MPEVVKELIKKTTLQMNIDIEIKKYTTLFFFQYLFEDNVFFQLLSKHSEIL